MVTRGGSFIRGMMKPYGGDQEQDSDQQDQMPNSLPQDGDGGYGAPQRSAAAPDSGTDSFDPAGRSPNTGVAGDVVESKEQPEAPGAPPAPDYHKVGKYGSQMGAWSNTSSDKFNQPWDKMSERYKMMTVLSNFDPTKGITPEVIAALNAAGINGASFEGSGDKLKATGLKNWEGYDGREGFGDVVTGFKSGKGTWSAWQPDSGGPSGATQGGPGASPGGFGVDENGMPSATGGQTTSVSDYLKSLLQRYYGGDNNTAPLMRVSGGTSLYGGN